MAENAPRDANFVPAALFQIDGEARGQLMAGQIDEATGRILVDAAAGGSVTSVSVVSANGFAGSVATATTTPAITLSTTVNAPALAGNGTAIAAATTTGTGSTLALATSAQLVTPLLGTPTSGVLSNCTGYPVASLANLGTGVATALAANVGSAGAPVTFNGALGTPSSGTVTNLTGTASININGTVGATTPATVAGTTVTASTGLLPDADDGAYIGQAGTAFSDLFLAEGGVISWDSGDATITQTGNVLAVAGADLRVATAGVGTDADSVPTLSSTSTLTAKTLTTPVINGATLNGDLQVDGTPGADDTWNGRSTNTFNAGDTIAQFDCVYLSSSSTWLLTDADAVTTAGSVPVMMAAEAGSAASPLRVILPGTFVRNDTWNWTPGAPLFLDTATPGGMTATKPSGTDDVVRVVAHAYTADVIFFNPSGDWSTIV